MAAAAAEKQNSIEVKVPEEEKDQRKTVSIKEKMPPDSKKQRNNPYVVWKELDFLSGSFFYILQIAIQAFYINLKVIYTQYILTYCCYYGMIYQ